MYYDPSGKFAIGAFLIGLAVSSLATWGLSEIFGSQIAGGMGSIANGGGAIATGIGLLAFGPIGIVLGVGLMAVGVGTIAFGTNEIVAGATSTNYFQRWGMSSDVYNGLNIGLNVVGTIAGNIGMKYASNRILNSIVQNPSKATNYKLWQMKTYGRYTTKYSIGTLDKRSIKAGQGYTLTNKISKSLGFIQYHPGGGHHGPLAYWKVTSSYNPIARFWYLSGLPF